MGGGSPYFSTTTSPNFQDEAYQSHGQMWRASKWWQVSRDVSLSIGDGRDTAQGGDSSGHGDHRPVGHDDIILTVS